MNKCNKYLNNDFCILVHWRNPFIANAGTEKYIQIQVNTLKENGIDSIVIFPVRKKIGITIFGWGLLIDKQFIGVFDEGKLIEILSEHLENNTCKGVFIHHLMWSNLESLQRILSFTEEIVYYIHDYYSCCEQQNLLKNDVEYCGDSLLYEDKCKDCKYYHVAVSKRNKTQVFFDSFKRIIAVAPSDIAADIWKEAYPEDRFEVKVINHLCVTISEGAEQLPIQDNEKIKIAFVGNGITSKGYDLWIRALTSTTFSQRERYKFYHLGVAPREYDFIRNVNVSISTDGPDAMVKKLQELDIQVAVLFSIWPETYSYTFFEALEANCFVITTEKSGNICVQVKKYSNGIVVGKDGLVELLDSPEFIDKLNSYRLSHRNKDVEYKYNTDYLDLLNDKTLKLSSNVIVRNNVLSQLNAKMAHFLYTIRYKNVL